MSNRVNISADKIYRDFFSKEVRDQIFLNDIQESSKVWDSKIDSNARHFFQLGNEHWIFKVNNKKLIDWLTCFNNGEYQEVESVLGREINWPNDEEIYFCISSTISFSCSWKVFKENWSDFLSIDDDCPIIINPNDIGTYILFEVSGRLLKLTK